MIVMTEAHFPSCQSKEVKCLLIYPYNTTIPTLNGGSHYGFFSGHLPQIFAKNWDATEKS